MIEPFPLSSRPPRILGLGGSLSRESRSLIVLETALRVAEAAGAETALLDPRTLALPLYDPDRHPNDPPPALVRLLTEVRAADGILLCSPTYHGTVTGAVKNLLDALDPLGRDDPSYLTGKVVGLIALGGGGAVNTLNALSHAARAFDAVVVPTWLAVPVGAVDVAARDIADPGVKQRLAAITEEVIELSRRLSQPVSEILNVS